MSNPRGRTSNTCIRLGRMVRETSLYFTNYCDKLVKFRGEFPNLILQTPQTPTVFMDHLTNRISNNGREQDKVTGLTEDHRNIDLLPLSSSLANAAIMSSKSAAA